MSYKNSFFTDKCESNNYTASFRPLWNWTNEDKKLYKNFYKIKHSDCYEIYGMTRTGCAGCPFNLNLQNDLQILESYEPSMHKAVCSIFKDAYNYIEKYNNYKN
ncbi:hypothetical protein [Candidatus Pelagibacter communis]|uniref:hypothetical protein n=1 Tax=Pelagibacter ubique TaxID=198252 RepID=UPI000A7E1490|nr:hypothetical protein [Candidatus Pelagibacter ubique]